MLATYTLTWLIAPAVPSGSSGHRAVEKLLDCGVLDNGFARVVCQTGYAEFLVAFSYE